MFRFINGLIDRLFVVGGALIFSQAPHFYQSYTQRLGGHAAELKYQINSLHQIAVNSGKTLPELIHKFKNQTDIDFSSQGNLMQSMLDRFSLFSDAHSALLHASPLSRPYYFFKYFNYEVAKQTIAEFHFGLALTMEGLFYALAGILFGFLVYRGLCFVMRLFTRIAVAR